MNTIDAAKMGQRGLGSRKGLALTETLIALSIIAVIFSVVVSKYRRVAHEAQEAALKAGLVNMRMSILLFKTLNSRNPHSLNELVEKDVMLPVRTGGDAYTGSIFKQKYLMSQAIDTNGRILDAFGNAFVYDPVRGEVRTTTIGFENW